MIRRLRKFILIGGTTLSVLFAAAFVVSGGWVVTFRVPVPPEPFVYLERGNITVALWPSGPDFDHLAQPLISWGWSSLNDWGAGKSGVGWTRFRAFVSLPLYALFLAVAVPTLVAWRLWPKPVKPGHCRCGYDLTGNTSGVCPECGGEVQA